MADEDDPFGDSVDDDRPDPDEAAAAAAAADEAARVAAAAKPAEPAKVDPSVEVLAKIGLDSLKNSWITEAKAAGVTAANFDSIGLTGLDETAKATFLETAKANHDTEIKRLADLGFVYDPGKTQEQKDQEAADAKESEQQVAWGSFGPPSIAETTGDAKVDEKIAAAAQRGDVRGVIGALPGLDKFMFRKGAGA